MIDYNAYVAERVPERLLEDLVLLAKLSPKVDEETGSQAATPVPYRQNFYKRFIELHAIAQGVPTDDQVIYIRTVKERFGLDLLRFYNENYVLCISTVDAIEAKKPYDILVHGLGKVSLMEANQELPLGSAQRIKAAANHTLGIDAIGLYYWNAINPLLERAYTIIDGTTLNAPFLTK